MIEHGKTGYFAYTEKDWYTYLKGLIMNPELRREIGQAGQKYALENFNVEKITQKYIDFLNKIIE